MLEAPSPFAYYAEAQRPSRYNFLLARTSGDAATLLAAMRRELLAMEPGLVIMDAQHDGGSHGGVADAGPGRRDAGA